MYGSKMALTRYHGNGSSSIFLAILCVAIVIVGDMWLISSFVTRGTAICATLVGVSGSFYGVASTLGAGVCCWCCLVGYQYVIGSLTCFGPSENSCVLLHHPLCLLVLCFSASFGMMFIIPARRCNNS